MTERWQQHSLLEGEDIAVSPKLPKPRRPVPPEKKLREAIAPYIDPAKLRKLASEQGQLTEALKTGDIPEELTWLLSTLAVMLQPLERDQVKTPADIAAHLMLKMGHLCQEQFCVVCLNTKNRVQKVHTVYQGSLNTAYIRIAEAYREPIRLNSAGVIFAHNHPSGDATPSPEDVALTRQLVDAGKLLDISCLDHIVIARDRWTSLRERGLGFKK